MIIEKAIERLSDAAFRGLITYDQDFKAALKLGYEALKHFKNDRLYYLELSQQLLPGETKE